MAMASSPLPPVTESKPAVKLALIAMVVVLSKVSPQRTCALAVNRVEFQLACMPSRKLTALCYGSVSAIVTGVTFERSAGTRRRQQGEKCSKKLGRCRSRDVENGFDRKDVL